MGTQSATIRVFILARVEDGSFASYRLSWKMRIESERTVRYGRCGGYGFVTSTRRSRTAHTRRPSPRRLAGGIHRWKLANRPRRRERAWFSRRIGRGVICRASEPDTVGAFGGLGFERK